MKNIALLLFLVSSIVYSQEKVINLDYVVDYAIPKELDWQENDTISIGFNKDGKFLWTNYDKLALDLAKSVIKNKSEDFSKAKSHIVYDTEEGSILLIFEFNGNTIFFDLKLDSLLRNPKTNESIDLIIEEVGETMQVLERDTNLYNMFPSEKPDKTLTIASDKEFTVDNSAIFKRFFEIAFGISDTTKDVLKFPNGLILKIIEKEKTIIEAINISNKKKTIKINYSFKITE